MSDGPTFVLIFFVITQQTLSLTQHTPLYSQFTGPARKTIYYLIKCYHTPLDKHKQDEQRQTDRRSNEYTLTDEWTDTNCGSHNKHRFMWTVLNVWCVCGKTTTEINMKQK